MGMYMPTRIQAGDPTKNAFGMPYLTPDDVASIRGICRTYKALNLYKGVTNVGRQDKSREFGLAMDCKLIHYLNGGERHD